MLCTLVTYLRDVALRILKSELETKALKNSLLIQEPISSTFKVPVTSFTSPFV